MKTVGVREVKRVVQAELGLEPKSASKAPDGCGCVQVWGMLQFLQVQKHISEHLQPEWASV